MALTRRFFTRLAASYRDARPASGGAALAVWMHMVAISAEALAEQNAMFKYDKFYEACGMPQEAIDRVTERAAG